MKRYTPSFGGNPRHLITPGGEKTLLADCTAANIPADGKTGYEKGCPLIVKDGGAGLAIYINTGTSTSCAFRPMLYGQDSSAVALTATIAEINHSCDLSDRAIAVGSSLDLSGLAATNYNDKTFLLDTAGGSSLTLPTTANGARLRVIVTTAPTGGNSHTIIAPEPLIIIGSVWVHDLDGATASYFASSANTTVSLNATTKGGAVGDSLMLEGIASVGWAVVGASLRCATGSNPATPFSGS